MMDQDDLPTLIRELYTLVDKLERMFPDRHFTPDGHLVGSLGEVVAAHRYGLVLEPASTRGYDALKGHSRVEIKATQGDRVAIRSCPEHLLVLRIDKWGEFKDIYNGPGSLVWELVKDKPRPSNGQYQVSLNALRALNARVPEHLKLNRVR